MILKVAFCLLPVAASIATLQMMPRNALAQSIASVAKTVNLTVADSSLSYVVYEIARQSGMKVVGSHSYQLTPILKGRKVSVQLKNANVQDAYQAALKGTELVAKISRNGETIAIRKRDAKNSVQDSVHPKAQGKVAGQVIDSTDYKVVSGATVMAIGQNISVSTDAGGSFVLSGLRPGKVIVSVRMLGYMTRQIEVNVVEGKEVSMTFMLNPTVNSLNQVVTTATGAQRRAEVPSDIVRINADEVRERAPIRSAVDLIEAAQVPGVLITRAGGDPGAPSRIRIRGIGSVSESNDPVVIMDGVWIDMTSTRLEEMDPASIESIEIVRGPSAATLYGQDAANGVIVVTTKRGAAGPTRLNFSYARNWGQTYGRMPLVYTGAGSTNISTRPRICSIKDVLEYTCLQDSVLISDPNNRLLRREGVETNNRYTAQMDGGSGSVSYSITLSNTNTIGVRRIAPIDIIRYRYVGYNLASEFRSPSELTRNNFTSNLSFRPRNTLSLNLTITGTQSYLKNNSVNNRWIGGGIRPISVALDSIFTTSSSSDISSEQAPEKSTAAVIASGFQYRPGNYLINGNFGIEKNSNINSSFVNVSKCTNAGGCSDAMGTRKEENGERDVYTVRLNASTSLKLGALNRIIDLKPTIGGDFKKKNQYNLSVYKAEVPPGERSIAAGRLVSMNGVSLEDALAGWYLNSTIGVFNRIYFDVGIRQDIGSAITSSRNNKYPKLGGAWLISQEPFWKHNSIVNSLRLRSAIGHAAVQPSLSDIHGKFLHGVEYIDGAFKSSSDLTAPGNNTLRPERSVEVELGLDVDMVNERVNLIGTYAHKVNRNTLIIRSIPPSLGTGSIGLRKENIARVQNRNFELSASARVIETKSILLILNSALTLSDNKVLELGDNLAPFGEDAQRVAAGYPLASAWSRKVMGFRDLNGDNLLSQSELILSDSSVYVGWSQPRNRGSYGMSLSYRNIFTLDSRFEYQGKYVQRLERGSTYGAEDVNASLSHQATAVIEAYNSQRSVSHIRWSSASISYHFPRSIVQRLRGRTVSMSLQGSNLGLWTNYLGRDPAVNSSVVGDSFGDNGSTPPRPRLYVLDFRVGY